MGVLESRIYAGGGRECQRQLNKDHTRLYTPNPKIFDDVGAIRNYVRLGTAELPKTAERAQWLRASKFRLSLMDMTDIKVCPPYSLNNHKLASSAVTSMGIVYGAKFRSELWTTTDYLTYLLA